MAEPKASSNTPGVSAFSLLHLLRRAGLDGFVLALMGMIGLAYLWPQIGEKQSPYGLTAIAGYGVSFIFFFYGLRLSPEKLKAGLTKWRLHLLVHLSTFVLFPVIILAGKYVFENDNNRLIWLGVFFLAALPSTVSSSVVMVSIAGGNIPAAIFNASISSLIGVFITPLWMGLVMETASVDFQLGTVISKLTLQVLVPVAAGIILHKRWGAFAEKHRMALRYFDQSVILLIVYTSFCESFARNMFAGFSIPDILMLGVCMIALFFFVYLVVHSISRLMGFSRPDRIAAVFCGSKKSLVHGTVMSKVLFPGSGIVGIVLLPLMLYHALQLIAASILAQSMGRKAGSPADVNG